MSTPFGSFCALNLIIVYLAVFCVVAWIPVPSTTAGVFSAMIVELMLSLAFGAMLIVLGEQVLEYCAALILRYVTSRNKMEEAVTLYFTKAAQELEGENKGDKAYRAEYAQVIAKMNQLLTLEVEKLTREKQGSTVVSSDSCGSITSRRVAPWCKGLLPSSLGTGMLGALGGPDIQGGLKHLGLNHNYHVSFSSEGVLRG